MGKTTYRLLAHQGWAAMGPRRREHGLAPAMGRGFGRERRELSDGLCPPVEALSLGGGSPFGQGDSDATCPDPAAVRCRGPIEIRKNDQAGRGATDYILVGYGRTRRRRKAF